MKKTGKERLKRRHGLAVVGGSSGPSSPDLVLRAQAIVDGESSEELGVYCCGQSIEEIVAKWERFYGGSMRDGFREGVELMLEDGEVFSVTRTSILFAPETFGDWDDV